MGKDRHGANGADVVLKVPAGTQIYEEDGETLLADLARAGQRAALARGREWRLRQRALQNRPPIARRAAPIRARPVKSSPFGCASS